MKRLLLSLALLGFVNSASAQVSSEGAKIIGDHSRIGATTPGIKSWGPAKTIPSHSSAPLHHDEPMFHFDVNLPSINWGLPGNFSPAVSITYGERFTLHTDVGFVDSVRLNFVSGQGQPFTVALAKDTLFETQSGPFHIIDIFTPIDYAAVQVPLTSIAQDGWVTVYFNHVAVPKDFFVVVRPALDGQSNIVLRGDSKPARTLTTENARSGMIAYFPSDDVTASYLLDGLISIQDQPVYTDFYIETYTSSEPSSVSRDAAAPASVYPNPVIAGGMLRVNHTEAISQIRIVNALGAEVSSWNGMSSNVELPIGQIASGVYHLLITSDSGVTSEKIVVQ